jgi:haloalkane dehalogenase
VIAHTRSIATQKQPHTTLRGGHFVQEDDPEGFVGVILKACGRAQ